MDSDIKTLLAAAAANAPVAAPMTQSFRRVIRLRRIRSLIATVMSVAVLASGGFVFAARLIRHVQPAVADCGGEWRVEHPVILAADRSVERQPQLDRAFVFGRHQLWAIGDEYGNHKSIAFTAQWTRGSWVKIDVPHTLDPDSLNDMAGDGLNLWAAGATTFSGGTGSGFITGMRPTLFHWDGSMWKSADPPPTPKNVKLTALTAVGVRGRRLIVAGTSDVILHYPRVKETPYMFERVGGAWTPISLPDLRGDYEVAKIVIEPSGDLVVLTHGRGGYSILHQHAGAWRNLAGGIPPLIGAIDVRSSRDIWATRPFQTQPNIVIEHWNGRGWSETTTPNQGIQLVVGIAARTPRDVWLLGMRSAPQRQPGSFGIGPLPSYPVMLHWSGHGWREIELPIEGLARMSSLVVAPNGQGLAVGSGPFGNPIVLRRC